MIGLLAPQSGTVRVMGGRPTVGHRRRHQIGYVPQGRLVGDFPITVAQVVMTGRLGRLGLLRWPGAADRQAVDQALAQVGLLDQRRRRLSELSGGQRQRVYLARALVAQPALLLLDEPLTGLDLPSQEAIYAVLAERTQAGVTIVVSTHDLECLEHFGFERLICLNCRIVADGPPAVVMDETVLGLTYGSIVGTVRRLLDTLPPAVV
jgi:manganese/iron transport system ATP-binding protein